MVAWRIVAASAACPEWPGEHCWNFWFGLWREATETDRLMYDMALTEWSL